MAEHYFTGEPTSRHEARTVCVQAGGRALAFETDAGTFSRYYYSDSLTGKETTLLLCKISLQKKAFFGIISLREK